MKGFLQGDNSPSKGKWPSTGKSPADFLKNGKAKCIFHKIRMGFSGQRAGTRLRCQRFGIAVALIGCFGTLVGEEAHTLNIEMPDGEKLLEARTFLGNSWAIPSTLVNGRVNAVTGSLVEVEQDIVVPGVSPFVLERTYAFAIDTGSLGYGWDHNHAEVLSSQWGKRHCYIVTKGKGTQLVYSSRDNESRQKLHPDLWNKGLTNCRGEISGRTNLKNYRVQKQGNVGRSLTTGSGTVSRFVKHHKYYYLHDILSDKLQRYFYSYGPDQSRMVSKVSAQNSLEKEWGAFTFHYPTTRQLKDCAHGKSKEAPKIRIESKDGRFASYELKPYIKSDYNGEEIIHFVIKRVNSSDNPPVKYEYRKLYDVVDESLTAIRWPENRYLLIEYDPILLGLKDSPRVKALFAPLGKNEKPERLYSFEYKGLLYPEETVVKDALNHQTIYRYSKDDHRLRSIEKYTGDKKYHLYTTETFQWGKGQDKGNLIGKFLEDGEGKIKRCQKFTYDQHGNVIQEELTGCLTGKSADVYIKTMTYDTAGGCNNKLSSSDFAVRYEYEYAPGTSLCIARYTIDQTIKLREFFSYDASGAVIEEIQDDGSSHKKEDWSGVTERHFKTYVNLRNGLPSVIEEGYFDLASGSKILLKKTVKTYDSLSRLIQEDVYEGKEDHVYSWKWEYNRLGLVTKEINPLGEVTTRSYDPNGNLIAETNPVATCFFQYDYANRLIKITKGSQVERFKYDFMGHKVSSTDVHGNKTRYTYDELGRLIEKINPGGHVEKYTYDIFGTISSKTTPKGQTTYYKNTANGKPYEKILPSGEKEFFEYDLKGNLVKYTSVDGTTTIYTYDYASRPLSIEIFDKQGKSIEKTVKKYNAFHLIEEIDPTHYITRYTYDGAGRLIKEQCEKQITEYGYDGLGRRVHIRKSTSPTDYVDELLTQQGGCR